MVCFGSSLSSLARMGRGTVTRSGTVEGRCAAAPPSRRLRRRATSPSLRDREDQGFVAETSE
jgi:hypothetical protein